jgi:hypothetical protein
MDLSVDETSTAMKIFGKNASEFLSNSVGTVLSLVNIALAAWDLATTTDPLQKTLDSLNIVSASLSIIGISAGWIAGTVEEGVEVGVMISCEALEMVSACMGPLSIVFAAGTYPSFFQSNSGLTITPPSKLD